MAQVRYERQVESSMQIESDKVIEVLRVRLYGGRHRHSVSCTAARLIVRCSHSNEQERACVGWCRLAGGLVGWLVALVSRGSEHWRRQDSLNVVLGQLGAAGRTRDR